MSERLTSTLLIPVLNEAEPLPVVLPKLDPSWVDEIVFVDGGSTDETISIIEAWGKARIIRQEGKGLADAYHTSLHQITTDIVVTFSPDGNSLPDAIPQLIDKVQQGYDMVIASRYLEGAGSADDDMLTGFGNWAFTTMINVLFRGSYTDTLVMLRAYRTKIVEEIKMDTRLSAFEPQLAIRCAVYGKKCTEIPGFEPKRIGGARKMHPWSNGCDVLEMIVRDWFRYLRGEFK
ncbi:MAG: glycosyltransferase family 2 protein [Candidatus Lindowbacteria bacterium]|nr:glycosyltransferase family 2 protein [Candidatus Lindowbacteria bacterium]